MVQITNLTDAAASEVDFFFLDVGGAGIQGGPFGFDMANNGSELAAAIDVLSGLIDVSYDGVTDVLTITASSTGPIPFANLRLETTTAATKTQWRFIGFDDSEAGATNKFMLEIDGVPVNQSGVNFLAATDLLSLASQLNNIPGIDSYIAGINLRVDASNTDPRVFTELAVIATPPQVTDIDSIQDTGDGSVVEAEEINVALAQLVVSFDSSVQDPAGNTTDKDVTNPANYLLFEDGTNDMVDTINCNHGLAGDDTAVVVNNVSYASTTSTATLVVNGFDDIDDDFPFDPSEWNDNDSDGTGDNADLDDDNDGIDDGLDSDPFFANNFCNGGPDAYIFSEMVVGPLTCAAKTSITAVPLAEVLATGKLHLIAPFVSFENGFSVLGSGSLTVTPEDPRPGCP